MLVKYLVILRRY